MLKTIVGWYNKKGGMIMTRDQVLDVYDTLISKCDRFKRKGKTMPFTSANGHMFSLVNKNNQIGFRYSKEIHKIYLEKYNTQHFMSYGAHMRGYITIPESLYDDVETMLKLINESYDYVMTLEPK